MSYDTIAIIYNPNSTGSSEQLARELESALRLRLPDQKIELTATDHAGHGKELAYSIAMASKNPLIISSSGDGGYHDIINGVMRAQKEGAHPTTGLLPAGNANDHYRNLHNDELIERIEGRKSTKIDLLTIGGISRGEHAELYAHSYIGFGLTPSIGKELNKTKLTIIRETWLVVRALFVTKSVKLKIGKKVRRYESIIFSNIDTMSKYFAISQPSSVTDGKCEVTIFEHRSRLRLIMTLLKASVRGVQEDHSLSEFSMQTVHKTLVQADGEIMTLDAHSDVYVKVEPRVLDCIV